MNLRVYIICIGVLLVLGLSGLASGVPFMEDKNTTIATVHGVTYAWDTLEPVNDTVIDVNSNPPQSIVAKDGAYSFELTPGDYTIKASYYENNSLIYSKETTIEIEDEGSYVLDLLLYPVSDKRATETVAAKMNSNGAVAGGQTKNIFSIISYLPVAIALFLPVAIVVAIVLFLLGGVYEITKKYTKRNEKRSQQGKINISGLLVKALTRPTYSGFNPVGEASMIEPVIESGENSVIETNALKKEPLTPELNDVLNIIRGNKGRITQKDLRGRLKYSEVKVSLLLSELEKRGLIKKFKNGRENIVVLIEEDP